jgi:hypothetical protein
MIQYWFILDKKPNWEENQWFNFVVGEKAVIDLFTKIDNNRVEKKTIRELYIEYHFKNRELDKEMINRDLNTKKRYYLETFQIDIFTKKGMKDYIFTKSNQSITLHNHCKLIAGDFKDTDDDKKYDKYDKEKYQKLLIQKNINGFLKNF